LLLRRGDLLRWRRRGRRQPRLRHRAMAVGRAGGGATAGGCHSSRSGICSGRRRRAWAQRPHGLGQQRCSGGGCGSQPRAAPAAPELPSPIWPPWLPLWVFRRPKIDNGAFGCKARHGAARRCDGCTALLGHRARSRGCGTHLLGNVRQHFAAGPPASPLAPGRHLQAYHTVSSPSAGR
jgi:hypothetical protein